MAVVQGLDNAGALDKKTEELSYVPVLAALRLESGIPFHVQSAKLAGASRAEIISAILIGLPAAGNGVIQSLPAALSAYDVNSKLHRALRNSFGRGNHINEIDFSNEKETLATERTQIGDA